MKQLIIISAMLATKLFALEVGDVAPCVVLEGFATAGESVTRCIRDRENSKQNYTVVDFALTTCEACEQSLPELSTLADSTTDYATTRVVYVDKSKQDILDYLVKHKKDIKFATALDTSQKAMKAWGVAVLPATFVLNKKNEVVLKHEGVLDNKTAAEIGRLVTGSEF